MTTQIPRKTETEFTEIVSIRISAKQMKFIKDNNIAMSSWFRQMIDDAMSGESK
jgi:hypothetical protein